MIIQSRESSNPNVPFSPFDCSIRITLYGIGTYQATIEKVGSTTMVANVLCTVTSKTAIFEKSKAIITISSVLELVSSYTKFDFLV